MVVCINVFLAVLLAEVCFGLVMMGRGRREDGKGGQYCMTSCMLVAG